MISLSKHEKSNEKLNKQENNLSKKMNIIKFKPKNKFDSTINNLLKNSSKNNIGYKTLYLENPSMKQIKHDNLNKKVTVVLYNIIEYLKTHKIKSTKHIYKILVTLLDLLNTMKISNMKEIKNSSTNNNIQYGKYIIIIPGHEKHGFNVHGYNKATHKMFY